MLSDVQETQTKSSRLDKKYYWSRWKLICRDGRQRWEYIPTIENFKNAIQDKSYLDKMTSSFVFDSSDNPNSADKIYRNQKTKHEEVEFPEWFNHPYNFKNSLIQNAYKARFKGIHFYQQLQDEDGHWPGDYGGPLFLLPGLIIVSYVTSTPFPEHFQVLMKQYMLNHQNEDGGWGLHIEGASTLFGTILQYVALRLLGVDPGEKALEQGRNWIISNGGATGIPSWGKFYLSVLGVYEWEGCNSLMPELWLLPKFLKFHPWRYWCHSRMVYMPMSYCYGHKVKGEITPLIQEIRKEIYVENYNEINWSKQRNNVSETDRFHETSGTLNVLNVLLNIYESRHSTALRKKALQFTLDYVDAEDEQTEYIDIGPVNQVINSLCIWHAYGNSSDKFKKHVDRWFDYLWLAEDGIKMNGYNGSQLWDTAFAVQAILEDENCDAFQKTIQKAYDYLDQSQVREEVKKGDRFFRHPSVGGWPFSTLDHGWPISDCTAEGLHAVLKAHSCQGQYLNIENIISDERLIQAAELILSFQNKDGGWATYENTRSGKWLELLNASEIFGDIMIDYSYVECTSACIRSLYEFHKNYPDYNPETIVTSIAKGIRFILSKQRKDGSWMGSWGVCFTYGTWFGVEALSIGRELNFDNKNIDHAINEACHFLVSKQKNDGGWGETYHSCVKGEYIQNDQSQIVNSSWALLSLLATEYPHQEVIDNGIKYLLSMQDENGDWPQQDISGVFNRNCMITYTSYRNVFPIWTLGRYCMKYGRTLKNGLNQLKINGN